MKNKGFTLIEIIVVVAVLGVIGTIVVIGFTNILENNKKEECNNFVKEIETAACVYAGLSDKSITCDENKCDDIPLSILVNEGLITSDSDSCTRKDLDLNATVSVKWNSEGEKICTYNGVKEYER